MIQFLYKILKRSYKCECCRIEIDRDYNAALNIRDVGKEFFAKLVIEGKK